MPLAAYVYGITTVFLIPGAVALSLAALILTIAKGRHDRDN
jgi:hypothetical protein